MTSEIDFDKGQVISKGLLVSSNSPKKQTNEFLFTTTTKSFIRFLGEFEDTKNPFEITWPLQITMVLQNLFQPTVIKLSDAWRNSSRMSSQSWQMMLWSYLTTYLNIKLLRRSLVRGCTKHRFDPKSCPMSSYKKRLVQEFVRDLSILFVLIQKLGTF